MEDELRREFKEKQERMMVALEEKQKRAIAESLEEKHLVDNQLQTLQERVGKILATPE